MKTQSVLGLVALVVLSVFFFETGFAKEKSTSGTGKLDLKKHSFGFVFKGKNPVWSKDLCKSVDYDLLKPVDCKQVSNNTDNKSILCNLPDGKSKLAAYLTIEDCQTDLQMSTEGDSP